MLATLVATVLLAPLNTLTAEEKKAGWELLFDGKSTAGWTNYRSSTIGKGWQVKDGALVVADPGSAGDIVTTRKFSSFELKMEINVGPGQNSGIMFHVGDQGGTAWMTGPEVQIYDHPKTPGVQVTGDLYELYAAEVDAQKPAGEWQTVQLIVRTSGDSETWLNGKKLYTFRLGSEDWKARVAKSKFRNMPGFGSLGSGAIAIQGDHGQVSFRNIKVRSL